jgi:2,3-bisphosphoglycerate-independent phosphoglycerate mutase
MDAGAEPRKLALGVSALVAVLGACLAYLAFNYVRAVNHERPAAALPPELRPVTPVSAHPRARPQRVVWVVIDGLRLDTSRSLPFLGTLRARGFDGVATAALPSLSRPSYSTMATGAEPVTHGVRTNSFAGAVPLDAIFDRVSAAGLRSAAASNLSWWNELFGRSFAGWYPIDGSAARAGAPIAAALGSGDLVLLHLVDLDQVAHQEGAGERYRDTARLLDELLEGSLASLDLERDALIVTSDHGHRLRGGHGGPEPDVVRVPLLLAGRGIARSSGVREFGSLAQIGPTIALLLGVELPRDATAEPVLDALDAELLGPDYLKRRSAEQRAHRAEYTQRLAPLTASSPLAPAGAALGLLLAPPGLFIGWRVWQRAFWHRARRGFIALPLIWLGALAALLVQDLPLSFSGIVTLSAVGTTLAIGTTLGFAVHAAALWRLLRSLPRERRAPAFLFHLRVAAFAHLAIAPSLWLLFGYRHAVQLPPARLMYLPLPAAFIGGLAAVLCCALSLLLTYARPEDFQSVTSRRRGRRRGERMTDRRYSRGRA